MDIPDFLSSHIRSIPLAPSILLVAVFVIYYLLSRLLRRRSDSTSAARVVLLADVFAFPGVLLVLLLYFNRFPGLPFASGARLLMLSLMIIVVTWLINRFLHSYYWSEYFEKQYGTPAPKILPNIVAVVLFLLAFYIIMTVVFKRSISGLLVSTGVLVGVIGLALQNLISDFFYGFSITLENPFYKGDWIEMSDGTVGQVVDISWHAIHLLSFNDSLYIVPNSAISRNTIHNLSRPTARYAMWLTISVDSAYPPERVRLMLTEAALSCSAVLSEPVPSINLSEASGNPYVYTLYVYFKDYIAHYRGKNDLYMAVHQRLERAGISPSAVKYHIATEEVGHRPLTEPSMKEELAATDLFSPLADEDISQLADAAFEKTFHPGDVIIQEGSTDTSLLIITGGVVQVVKTGPGGREIEIDRFGAGDFLGEMSLLTGQPRSATVRALVTVRSIIVPKEGLEPILQRNPSLSEQIAAIMVERKMRDPQFSKRVQDSPTPTSHLLRLYMERIGRRISEFFRTKNGGTAHPQD